MSTKIVLEEKFNAFSEPWAPRIVAQLNGQEVRLVKLLGALDWHYHESGDELFLIIRGTVLMELRDLSIDLAEGEMFVVPRGVEHRPFAAFEAWVLLFEPAGTVNRLSPGGKLLPADARRL